eukprot:433341-Heterocapsa_arctica.AAC.1
MAQLQQQWGLPVPPPPAPLGPPAPHGASSNRVQWWLDDDIPGPEAPADHRGPPVAAAPQYLPPTTSLTTLGWLKHLEDPVFPWLERHYLKCLH